MDRKTRQRVYHEYRAVDELAQRETEKRKRLCENWILLHGSYSYTKRRLIEAVKRNLKSAYASGYRAWVARCEITFGNQTGAIQSAIKFAIACGCELCQDESIKLFAELQESVRTEERFKDIHYGYALHIQRVRITANEMLYREHREQISDVLSSAH